MDEEFDLKLSSGRIHARRVGAPDAPLVLCVHGLSGHLHSFDFIAERLASDQRQIVAIDLRGRGRSDITPPGSYGLESHERDVLEAANLLGAARFDLVGWSMGALIGIGIARRAPQRLRRLALIDHAGHMDAAAVALIERSLARLDAVVSRPDLYIAAIRAAGTIRPWSAFWDRYYGYELGAHGDKVKPTTSRTACAEDLAEAVRHDWRAYWKSIAMPALLVRCLAPTGGGYIVPEAERDALLQAVPQLRLVEVASDHFMVMVDEDAARAIRELLDTPAGG